MKTWLITGISSGFEREMTKQLLENGNKVIGTVRDMDKVVDLIEQHPDTFFGELLDVTNVKAIQELVSLSYSKHEKIDV